MMRTEHNILAALAGVFDEERLPHLKIKHAAARIAKQSNAPERGDRIE